MSHIPQSSFRGVVRALAVGVACVVAGIVMSPAGAQQSNSSAGVIYTCADAAGRNLTSDRPIASCMDREQRVLSGQGLLLKIIAPELTGVQRAAQQAQDHQAALALQRQRDQKQIEQALAIRYPTRAAHEAARHGALAQQQTALDDARQELVALQNEHQALADQMRAYQKNPDQTPAKLRHDATSNAAALAAQQQIIASLQTEVDRINAQFDAEDKRLLPIWAAAATQ